MELDQLLLIQCIHIIVLVIVEQLIVTGNNQTSDILHGTWETINYHGEKLIFLNVLPKNFSLELS